MESVIFILRNNLHVIFLFFFFSFISSCKPKDSYKILLYLHNDNKDTESLICYLWVAVCTLGANVNHQATDLATPLLIASQEGHEACVDLLLDNGADPNRACSRQWFQLAIHAAAQFGHSGYKRTLSILCWGSEGAHIDKQTLTHFSHV